MSELDHLVRLLHGSPDDPDYLDSIDHPFTDFAAFGNFEYPDEVWVVDIIDDEYVHLAWHPVGKALGEDGQLQDFIDSKTRKAILRYEATKSRN